MEPNIKHQTIQTLALAFTDESFVKQNQFVAAQDVFSTDPQQWVWNEVRNHYRRYDEMPSASILQTLAEGIAIEVLKVGVQSTLAEIQTAVDVPMTNAQWVKDQFNDLVSTQRLKNALNGAADMVSVDHAKAQEILRDYVNTPKQSNQIHPVSITEFKRPEANDLNELIQYRFLSRGGACLLIGPSGVGKSTLATQLAIAWGIGSDCVGFKPTATLKTLIVQAEDDQGDIGEMCESVMLGLNIQPGSVEAKTLANNVKILSLNTACGDKFIELLDGYLAEFTPDVLIINPVLSFLGGDTNSQRDVGKFLRNGLNPLLVKYNTACIAVHHIAKPSRDNKKNGWSGSDFQYAGLGSVEWTNWARCSLTIVNTTNPDVYILRAGKRGKRLGWKDAITGENTIDKYISHSKEPGILYWKNTDRESIETLSANANESNATNTTLLKHIPFAPSSIPRQKLVVASGLGERTVDKYVKSMITRGDVSAVKLAGKPTTYSRVERPSDCIGED